MERIAFSVDEAAHSAGIGLTKLREEIREGRLVARKIGKRTVVTATDLAGRAHVSHAAGYPRALPVVRARNDSGESTGAFCPLRATQPTGHENLLADRLAQSLISRCPLSVRL